MKRIDCIRVLADLVREKGDPVLVVTTAGGATHEWWAVGDNRGQLPARTLGLCSSIGLGLAVALPHRQVIVLDGDGGLLMNVNSLITSSVHRPANLLHVCFDNGVYESSGGSPTFTSQGIDLGAVARAAGIAGTYEADDLEGFRDGATGALSAARHAFLLARVEPGLGGVPPIPIDEVENKYRFARFVEELEGIKILAGPTSPVATERPTGPAPPGSGRS
jgi:sulfopyruvate decarboxylase subunit beta